MPTSASILAYCMALQVLIASIGIPVWQHACEMEEKVALNWQKNTGNCCSQDDTNACQIPNDSTADTEENDDDCCKDELKLHQLEVYSSVIKKIAISAIYWLYAPKQLIFEIILAPATHLAFAVVSFNSPSPPLSGRLLSILYQSFLI